MRRRLAAVLLLAVTVCPAFGGEPLYVVEQVIVSVNAAADGSGERIASLKSGERVELIERAGEAVHVRLGDGREGWLRAIYLSGDAPLKPRLAQAEAEVGRLQGQVSHLQAQLGAATSASHETVTDAAPPATEESPPSPAGALFTGPAEKSPQATWPWALGAGITGLGLGFALGWRVLDRHIRRKFGGLRIY